MQRWEIWKGKTGVECKRREYIVKGRGAEEGEERHQKRRQIEVTFLLS